MLQQLMDVGFRVSTYFMLYCSNTVQCNTAADAERDD